MKVCKPHVNVKSMADDGSRKWQSSVDNAEASTSKGNSNYQGHLSKMSKVEEIVEDLERRHGENNVYTTEQIRVWAHMIQLKQHNSYNEPPDKPFFRHSKCKSSGSEGTLSPAKRINLRTKCINQLDKWHMRETISSDQYQQLQDTILSDIKRF